MYSKLNFLPLTSTRRDQKIEMIKRANQSFHAWFTHIKLSFFFTISTLLQNRKKYNYFWGKLVAFIASKPVAVLHCANFRKFCWHPFHEIFKKIIHLVIHENLDLVICICTYHMFLSIVILWHIDPQWIHMVVVPIWRKSNNSHTRHKHRLHSHNNLEEVDKKN